MILSLVVLLLCYSVSYGLTAKEAAKKTKEAKESKILYELAEIETEIEMVAVNGNCSLFTDNISNDLVIILKENGFKIIKGWWMKGYENDVKISWCHELMNHEVDYESKR